MVFENTILREIQTNIGIDDDWNIYIFIKNYKCIDIHLHLDFNGSKIWSHTLSTCMNK